MIHPQRKNMYGVANNKSQFNNQIKINCMYEYKNL